MTAFLTSLTFATPWILSALLILPAIWWLLRLMPPAPKKVRFPAIQFLLQIAGKEESRAKMPLWLLLLRLMIAALVIVALAGPSLNRTELTVTDRPIVLFIDNDWLSAGNWDIKEATLNRMAKEFYAQDRLVYIVTTAHPQNNSDYSLKAVSPDSLSAISRLVHPLSQGVDHRVFEQYYPALSRLQSPEIFWFTNGYKTTGSETALIDALEKIADLGSLTIYRDKELIGPPIIRSVSNSGGGITVEITRPANTPVEPSMLLARSESGKILEKMPIVFDGTASQSTSVTFKLPNEIRNDLSRFEIQNSKSAGSVFLLDDRWKRRTIGLVTNSAEENTPSLLEENYYLENALLPFYDIKKNTLSQLIEENPALIAMRDTAALPAKQSSLLEKWISDGGILIRFAGPKLANARSGLLPVPLRAGNRNLDGAMSWGKPAKLGKMPENSPFSHLTVDPNITVSKQVLANPSPELSQKTWAQLADGTPLVTADDRGRGKIILFHTTAKMAWSDLAISGLFVEMLREISFLGSFSPSQSASDGLLAPLALLDGFGRPIDLASQQSLQLSYLDPQATDKGLYASGYYGSPQNRIANNVGPNIDRYAPINLTKVTATTRFYEEGKSLSFMAPFLSVALGLILIDSLIMIFLLSGSRLLTPSASTKAVIITFTAGHLIFSASDSYAKDDLDRLLQATLETRLAYIITGDTQIDEMSKAGLTGLSKQLRRRTAIEAAQPLPIKLEQNELIFFPMIYWPITADFEPVSDQAIEKINHYLKIGGTILFDTRNQFAAGVSNGNFTRTPEGMRLRSLLSRLDIQRLTQVPADHVLTRSFYLMQTFPGRYHDGELWVENTLNAAGNDGVASIVVGSNDWAAAWAINFEGRPVAAMVPGGERQREMAFRFGINLVMYTLAGNYKADQVHIPAILERLGQ
ncbi:DUF4159 domain-containing protein [Sneathiella aquimaris]|uniref:DUF4159 domain-containing protein n=1 Tax=Sneathiella aquimaris TaxID=2599305 RepID=UPI00146A671D|nr:DUF4159 domain-containing protein [Sneathiella aquimaris]